MTNKLTLALAAALFSLPTFAFAQDAVEPAPEAAPMEEKAMEEKAMDDSEESSNFSWNAAVVSDYVFRGQTQNAFKPAFQGGLDYAFGDSGFYVGGWASTVDFGNAAGTDVELDTYIGYNVDASEMINLDARFLRYTYLGTSTGNDFDYNEFVGAISFNDMITFTVGYAPDYFGVDGEKQLYTGLSGSWEVSEGVNLTAGFAHTDFDNFFTDYNDWTVGINKQFKYVNVGLNYYDTDLDNKASDQFVLSFSIGG
jgi:uncharacterized protein (TIGR02001 family)